MDTTSYIAVQWHHHNSGDPIELFSELDIERNEVRKVEVYADGSRGFASQAVQSGDTYLGIEPVPPLTIIAADPEFTPREITTEEFEAIWALATGKNI